MATVLPAVGTVPLAVRFPAVPQHCAQLQYAVRVKVPDAFFPILRQVTTLEEAMDPQTAQKNMESAVEQVFRVIRLKERNW